MQNETKLERNKIQILRHKQYYIPTSDTYIYVYYIALQI